MDPFRPTPPDDSSPTEPMPTPQSIIEQRYAPPPAPPSAATQPPPPATPGWGSWWAQPDTIGAPPAHATGPAPDFSAAPPAFGPGPFGHAAPVATAPVRRPRRRVGVIGAVAFVAICLVSAGAGAAGVVLTRSTAPTAASVPNADSVAAVVTPAPAGTPSANDAPVTDSENAIVHVVETVGPAVVTIEVGGTTSTTRNGLGQGGQGSGQVAGTGSGVIVDASGWILTNRHVVSDAKTVNVRLADKREFTGTVKGVDTLTDLAIVKIDATGLPTATLGDSGSLKVGQTAIVIGDPLGQFEGSVSAGIISGLDREVNVSDRGNGTSESLRHLIQTDAAINPGNSGGAMLDSSGLLIGINTAEAGQATSIGFALPIDLAKPILAQVISGQTLSRPWIGINYQEVDAQLAKDNNLKSDHGAWIHAPASSNSPAVVVGSPADKAGLKDGDIITAVDSQPVDANHALDAYLLTKKPDDTISLTVVRADATIQVDVTLGTRPANLP